MEDAELRRIWMSGYRSIFDLRAELGRVNVVVGENGTGKTNLYRGLQLLTAAARGTFIEEIAREGGMLSAIWAGERAKGPVRVVFGVEFSDLSYELTFGLTPATPGDPSFFKYDPDIKEEVVWPSPKTKRSWLFRRRESLVEARGDDGDAQYPGYLQPWAVGLAEIKEPASFPELTVIRRRLAGWRFYHQFRSDDDSPLRSPSVGWRSPVLASDGSNLIATLQTIREDGETKALDEAVAKIFGGGWFDVRTQGNVFDLDVTVPHLGRPLALRELSDGQLRFLCLAAALLSPIPSSFLVFNEPEASLFDEVLPDLADLIDAASDKSQIWLTTHSRTLADLLQDRRGINRFELTRNKGKTEIVGQPVISWS